MSQGYPPGPPPPSSWNGPPQGYGPPPGPPPKRTNWAAIVGFTLLGILVLGFGSCALCVGVIGAGASAERSKKTSGHGSHRDRDSAPAAADDGRGSAQRVKIDKLLADYKANEVSADNLYRDKWIMTEGKVEQISKSFTDSIYVVLAPTRGESFLEGVHCNPSSDTASRAGMLKKGDKITVRGRVRGYMLASVILDDCVLP